MAVSVQRAGKPPRQRCLQQAGAPRGAPKPQRWPPDGLRGVFSFVLVLATRCSGCVPAPSRSQALQAVLGVCPQGPGGGQEAAGDGAPGCSSSAFLPVASPRELASAGGVDTRPRRGQPGGARGPVCSAGRLLWEAAHSPGQPRESAEASVSARGAGPRRGSHCWVWAWALEGASAGLACCPWALGGRLLYRGGHVLTREAGLARRVTRTWQHPLATWHLPFSQMPWARSPVGRSFLPPLRALSL